MPNTNEKLNLPIVNAIDELRASNKDNRERLQKSMRAGLLNIRKSVDGLNANFVKAFELQKVKDAFDREKAREDSRKSTKVVQEKATKSKGGDGEGLGFFGWAGILAVAASSLGKFVTGFVVEFSKSFKAIFFGKTGFLTKITGMVKGVSFAIGNQIRGLVLGVNMYFNLLKNTLSLQLGSIINAFRNSKILAWFKNSKAFAIIFKPLGDAMRAIGWLMNSVTHLTGLAGKVGGVFARVSNLFSGIFRQFASVVSKFGWVSKAFGALGGVLGKIFIPINILVSIWQGVTGFIEGFTNFQGPFLLKLLAGFTQGAKDVLGWLVVAPLNLLKDLVSWIAVKLGWGAFAKILDNFSFGANFLYPILDFLNLAGQFIYVGLRDAMTNLWSGVKFVFGKLWGWISSIFTDPVGALKGMWNLYFSGLDAITDVLIWPINKAINWIAEAFGWKSEDTPDFNLKTYVVDIIKGVWDDITSIFDPILNFDWSSLKPDWLKKLTGDDKKDLTERDAIRAGGILEDTTKGNIVKGGEQLRIADMQKTMEWLQKNPSQNAEAINALSKMINTQSGSTVTVVAPSTTDASQNITSSNQVNVPAAASRAKSNQYTHPLMQPLN